MATKTPAGRLTEEGVRAIRAMRAETNEAGKPKHTYAVIAERFGLTVGTVFQVCTLRTWKWLDAAKDKSA